MDLLKERVFSELKEAFFLMREEKMMYSNETVIGENCFFDPKSSPALLVHMQIIVKSIKEVNLRQRSSCLKSIEMNKTFTKRWKWESSAIKSLTIMLYRRKNSLRWCHTQGYIILNLILKID